ncbi:DUF4231 domain-containing protein [Streptomyces sp. NPDC052773]|jgi:hypothetical protein|uniref:DUF4231 domain-containing protein n=1 Tax=Streptomyces sp. NPDC052773 TaxID=3365693 RepID=UPI0037CEA0A8
MSLTISDSDLPGLFAVADEFSIRGQRTTLLCSRIRLWGAVAAALGGVVNWSRPGLNPWAALTVVGFAAALTAEIVLLSRRPERAWYSGRAVAESVKTLAWRFSVGGDPFPVGLPPRHAQDLLRARLSGLVTGIRFPVVLPHDAMATSTAMGTARAASFEERKAAYLACRIQDQQDWYGKKARINDRSEARWRIALIVGEVTAVLLAVARMAGLWDVDLAGILAALVGSGAGWMALKQYANLAEAYSVASMELVLTHDRLTAANEGEWSQAVADAEDAISREHTMWLASRSGQAL